MTTEEFNELSTRPSMECVWGGQQYVLSSLDHKSKTCFLKKPGKPNMKPYPVSYTSVELKKRIPRKRNNNNK